MDVSKTVIKIKAFLIKYRFPALILLIGIALMIIPSRDFEINDKIVEKEKVEERSADVALAEILSKIDGAGEVKVLLSIATGEETLYQTDEDHSQTDTTTSTRITTITVTGTNRNEEGLIKQINPPTYLGAIIICQGADSASVRLAIVDAVSKLTGLGADSIAVLKMK